MIVRTLCLLAMVISPALANSPEHDDFPASMRPVPFTDIAGWEQDDHAAAFQAFLRSCQRAVESEPKGRASGVSGSALAAVCATALGPETVNPKRFFEQHFEAFELSSEGLLTGYFEPEVAASPVQTERFQHPIYRRPPFLQELPDTAAALRIDDDVTWGLRTETGFAAFPDRSDIMAGALEGRGLELAWLESPIDVFFIHIQGSARLVMTDGTARRINFAGKSGHQYTAIGRTLVEQGAMQLADVSMDSIREWLEAAPHAERDAVLASNRSYIFFKVRGDVSINDGPVAAAGVSLTAGRSLAVDRFLHTFGTPIFVRSTEPLPGSSEPLQRLMIAQDAGSAILGPSRGDIYIGSGDAAGQIAGRVNMPVTFYVLVPKSDLTRRDER